MKICLVGVSCVGKTTMGKRLAERLGYAFFDLDAEIEDTFGTSIERLKSELLTEYSFRQKAALVLKRLVRQQEKPHCVVALPPSGLMDHYARVLKQGDCVTIALYDRPEHILARITFYDKGDRLREPNWRLTLLTRRSMPSNNANHLLSCCFAATEHL